MSLRKSLCTVCCAISSLLLCASAQARSPPVSPPEPEEPDEVQPAQRDDEPWPESAHGNPYQLEHGARWGRLAEGSLQLAAGTLSAGVGTLIFGISGAILGLVFTNDELGLSIGAFGGGILGMSLGAISAVQAIGLVGGSNGKLWATAVGSAVGAGLGSLYFLQNPDAAFFVMWPASVIGAMIGYQISDREERGLIQNTRIQAAPTQGGAYAQFSFSF